MPVLDLCPRTPIPVYTGAQGPAWPLPSALFRALHVALHRAYPQVQLWEHCHASGVNNHYPDRHTRPQRFGSLTTAGPFPCLNQAGNRRWLFPSPDDLNRPFQEVRLPLSSTAVVEHQPNPTWMTKASLEAYLGGAPGPAGDVYEAEQLWVEEPASSTREPGTGSGHGHHRTSGKRYLRLMDPVTMGAYASMTLKAMQYGEGLDQARLEDLPVLCWGGVGQVVGLTFLEPEPLEHWLPLSAPVTGHRVKWLLLTPAVFPEARSSVNRGPLPPSGRWFPDWICPNTGRVLLRKGDARRGQLNRDDWRRHVRQLEAFACRLVGLSLPQRFEIGGWTDHRHRLIEHPNLQPGPRPKWQAVPAGSVYYFEGADAPQLAEALAWHGQAGHNPTRICHRRSTLWGEQGFGLGVCGSW